MTCFFSHKFLPKAVTVGYWLDRRAVEKGIIDPRKDKGNPETNVLYVCTGCGKPKVETMDGEWSLEQLTP
jgi:hypothetical protein